MKFFLFRREEINVGSVKSSDSGIGLSVFAIPVSEMAFMTAVKEAVTITFNNAGIYESTGLFEGESIQKTTVTVSCVGGEETKLMEDILDFVTSESPKKKVMRFDVVEGKSSFDSSVSKGLNDVSTQVRINPTIMTSGDISKGDPSKEYLDTIGEIYFGADKPSLDFNHEGLSGYANSAEVTAWANAGTGGSTYSIAANVGDPLRFDGLSAVKGLSRPNVFIDRDDYFVVPNTYTVSGEYTLYVAFVTGGELGVIYGDDSGDTMGFCFGDVAYDASGGIDKARVASSTFKVRHDGRTGEPAFVKTNTDQGGTLNYGFPEAILNPDSGETCQVFIIRRDANFNMYIHNRFGETVGFIPAFTSAMTSGGNRVDMKGMTDGDLLIEQIGSGGGIVSSGPSLSFAGRLARFGVIEKDIGTSKSGQLAQELFNLYNF